jgi:hypothetical protein
MGQGDKVINIHTQPDTLLLERKQLMTEIFNNPESTENDVAIACFQGQFDFRINANAALALSLDNNHYRLYFYRC